MLDAALDENPGARVMVKLHPEVIAGRRQGYLAERARQKGVGVIAADLNALSLVERTSRVYTVTSQCGIEALLCGTRVTRFGMPFYAGWGATDDRARCPRRSRRRSPLEIFALAYGRYARYVDPIRGEACWLGEWLERLALLKRADQRNRGHTACLGFAGWQRRQLRPFLRTSRGTLDFARDPDRASAAAAAGGGRLCGWAARLPADLEQRAEAAGVPLIRVEDGFLRSIGLGCAGRPAASLVFDRRDIHYDPSRPSELEEILEYERFDDELLDAARRLRRHLLEHGLTKHSLEGAARFQRAGDGRRRILVPGQVEDDASLRLGAGETCSNLALLQAVRAACPDACLIYKPHPEVESGHRRGRLGAAEVLRHGDAILCATSAHAALLAVDEVHTMTSLIGFEALLREVPVVTYGAPFYAGWGLTEDRVSLPRRTRRLSLDQLVAGALILYPSYVDPVTGLPCDAETVAWRLSEARRGARHRRFAEGPWLRPLARALRALTPGVGPLGSRSAG
jgi:capsular polysaccharide export protein